MEQSPLARSALVETLGLVGTHQNNMAALIIEAGIRHAGKTAFKFADKNVSYTQLRHIIVAFALRLRSLGVKRGSCLVLAVKDPLAAITGPLAFSLLGCSWVQAINSAVGSKVLDITHTLHDGLAPPWSRGTALKIDPSWFVFPADFNLAAGFGFEGFSSPSQAWMIAPSSGTTGTPKFMAVEERIAWSLLDFSFYLSPGEIPLAACLMHPMSRLYILTFMRVVAKGGTFLSGDLDFLADNRCNFVIGAPVQYGELCCNRSRPPGLKLPLAMIVGGRSSAQILEDMFRNFDRVLNNYGSTEAGFICSGYFRSPTDDTSRVGRPEPGAVIRIVDGDGRELPPGETGIVKLRTPSLVSSYIGDAQASAQVLRDGWFYPGDYGYLSAEGDLYITGRPDDVLNLGGVKINGVLIDEIIQSVAGVREGMCFVQIGSDGAAMLAALIAIEDDFDPVSILSSLRIRLLRKLGSTIMLERLYLTDNVPRNANGKAMRHAADEAARGLTPL